jgi:recombination protein RecT
MATDKNQITSKTDNDVANQQQTAEQQANAKTVTELAKAKGLVQAYGKKLLNSEQMEQFVTHLSVMAQKDPKFNRANSASLVTGMLACMNLGLLPNTAEQYAYLIPFESPRGSGKYDIQFQVGYKGLVELAYRSGSVGKIDAELIFPEDDWSVELGTERKLVHRLTLDSLERDRTDTSKMITAYATASVNGKPSFYILTKSEIEKIRTKAVKAVKDDTPWAVWEEEQIKKTAVKRFTKLLPKSGKDNRLAMAVTLDSLAEAGKLSMDAQGNIIEGEVVSKSEDGADQRKQQILAAQNKRKEQASAKHTPAPVETGDEQGEA